MRHATVLLWILATAFTGCAQRSVSTADLNQGAINHNQGRNALPSTTPLPEIVAESAAQAIAGPVPVDRVHSKDQQASLDAARSAQTTDRKIIRNAEMTIETDSPNQGQQKIAAIADKHGGFVVISESKQNEAVSQTVASTVVNVVVRVPAQNFESTIAEIRNVGGRILYEKSAGQDVTEEYIDLDARIRTKRALEAQILEIMKQAHKISDAMEVQNQLTDVRTEIERLEGRRRFLENQSALSTINITLHTPTPVVAAATRGFIYDLKSAFGDGLEIGTDIFLGIIRFLIVMIPVIIFILAPVWFVLKWLRKRIPWPAKPAPVSVTSVNE